MSFFEKLKEETNSFLLGMAFQPFHCSEMIFHLLQEKMMTSYLIVHHFTPWDRKYNFSTLKKVEKPHIFKSIWFGLFILRLEESIYSL